MADGFTLPDEDEDTMDPKRLTDKKRFELSDTDSDSGENTEGDDDGDDMVIVNNHQSGDDDEEGDEENEFE